ncbi:hypothetical protein SAMN03159341_1071 [Paenibacillus sp. 1_12]|uniref:hypothetical protein n=1 Tax=Paenibacillus sp. 1_12 TaxID=1566278 RepID=UPI0008E9F9DD|nr:hypothetical protein [Paenibacillus sp. 1_12]SFL52854.1 hypothetical protein SAMN03159341_1071 [Paenibacillus sp. 1_12]
MNQEIPLNNPTNRYQDSYGPQAPVVPVKDWIIALIISAIPIVNIVMWFIWAFGGNTNPNKQSFFKAYLLLLAIVVVIYAVVFVIILVTIGTAGLNSGVFDSI